MGVVWESGVPPSFDGVTGLRAGMAGLGSSTVTEGADVQNPRNNAPFHQGQLGPGMADGRKVHC